LEEDVIMDNLFGSPAAERDPLQADRAPEIHVPIESEAADAADPNTSLFYKHLSVTREAGAKLVAPNGGALRASRIKIWVDDVYWRSGLGSPPIVSPNGNGDQADTGWVFDTWLQLGVLLFQRDPQGLVISVEAVTADNPANAQECGLDNGLDILINVNDVKGAYGDNSGAYSLHLDVLQL
jgi:hypothetical protein